MGHRPRHAAGNVLYVAQIVVCELAWVLRHAYDKRREEIAAGNEFGLDRLQEVVRRYSQEPLGPRGRALRAVSGLP